MVLVAKIHFKHCPIHSPPYINGGYEENGVPFAQDAFILNWFGAFSFSELGSFGLITLSAFGSTLNAPWSRSDSIHTEEWFAAG